MKHNPKKNQLLIEAMEPRLLFSADLDGGLVSGGLAGHSALLNPALVDSHLPATTGADDARAASAIRQELVLVDMDTPDYQQLIDDLVAQQDETRHLEVILLDNTRDGIHQVTEILSNYRGLDAVHLISHGSEGTVDLGGSVLEFESLKANTGLIQSWGEAFSANGDLLIYGCDLAATAGGQGMVDALGRLTGADVAASDDLTGNAALGGDWELEYKAGEIETGLAVSSAVQQQYKAVLAIETVADDFNSGDNFSGSTGSQAWNGNWIEVDTLGTNDPLVGYIEVTSGELVINGTGISADNISAAREVDLSSATSATFSFDFRTDSGIESSDPDSIVIEVSGNGGSSWTILEDINYLDGVNSGSRSYDISAYTAVDTQIRFRVNNGYGGPDEFFYVDNVQIQYTINTAPSDISLSNTSVNENINTTGGYSVGTLTATDVDAGDTHNYTIVGGADQAKFSIGGAGSDELILTDGVLDFETQSSYQVMVRVTDSGTPNLSYDETLTITVNDQTGNISGSIFTDEGVTGIGAGVNISMVINGVLQETVTTDGTGSYSFKKEAGTGDAVAVFIDNDATYQGITVTVSDGTDLGGIQVFANHIVVRNDNGGATSITDMDNALGAYADPDIHYAVVGGNLVANAAGSEILVPAGHTFIPGGDVNATSIKILGTVSGGSNTFNIVENWDSATGSWLSNTSTVNLIGTGTLNSTGDSFYNLTTGAASQVTTLTGDLTVRGVLTIADSTGTLTDSGVGYDITVTGTGTPFVNNGAAVTARNFIYRYPTDATIIAAGGTYNVTESLWIAGSGTGSGTTYQLNGDLQVSGGFDVYATSFGVSILDTMGHNITANSLQVSNSAFQVGILSANNSTIDINGDVDLVNSVTTSVNLGASVWSVYGNWTNNSNTFNAGTSTVTLDGVNQQLSGSTAFYNLTKVEGSNDGTDSVLTFDNTATQTINGTLTLTGLDADDRINLVSDVPGTQWGINLTASAAHALNYIVLTDSDASGSDPGQLTINPANSFSGGNNSGWFGATAGDDAYSVDEGSTTNLDLSTNDSDADGLDLASIVITSGPTNGSITVNANGTVDYTHDDSETLSDSFTYTINDTLGEVSNIATVTLTVNPVNEAPVINDQAFSIDENRPMNTNVGTPAVTDPDTGDTLTWSITGGTGATAFSILSPSGLIRVADPAQINFETNPVLTLDIQVEDSGGLLDTATITININDLNERPTLNDTTFTIDENSANGTSVGTMVGTDPDGGDSLTYSIIGGNIGNAFTIDPVTGEITVNDLSALDYETIGNAGSPAFASQTGAANPFNGLSVASKSAPAFVDIDGDGDLDAFVGDYAGNLSFFENIGDATTPNFVAVSGPGNPLDSVNVTSRSTPAFVDIDNDGDQDIFVGHRWGGMAFYENVGDAANPSFVQVTGAGNPLNGANVVNMSTPSFIDIDGDGDLDTFIGEWYGTVKFFENTGDAANPAFIQQTGAANPLNAVAGGICCGTWQPKPSFADLDADGDYDAFIGMKNGTTQYWENTGDATTPAFSLQTGDANPLRTAITGGGGEAAPAFADIDGDGDLDMFAGNAYGAIKYFENKPVFNLTVQAEDSGGLTNTATVRIDLDDVNEDPTDIDLSNNLVDELIDTTGGYSVGTLSTTDEDGGEIHNYSVVGGADQAKFTIGGAGLNELILTDSVLDFETQSSYQVTVRVTDSGAPGLTYDETFTITVNDLNDAPVLTGAFDLTTIDEDPVTNNGTPVSALSAGQISDADAGSLEGIAVIGVDNSNGTWEYSIDGGGTWLAFGTPGTSAARLLAADASTYVRFVPNANWNGTVTNGLSFHAWDRTGGSNGGTDDLTGNTGGATPFSSATASSSIVVNAMPDAPVIGGDDIGSVMEDAGVVGGYLVDTGSLTIVDPDAGEDNFTAETIAGAYGSLTIDAAGNWNYSALNSQAAIQALGAGATLTDTLTVTTADGTTHDVVITINGTNDTPFIGGVDTGNVTEDVDPDSDGLLETSGNLTITDVDTGEANFTAGTVAGTYGSITIDAAGNWSYAAINIQAVIQSLPAGATLTDTLTVSSADGTTHDVVITINGVNDAPVIGGADTGAVTEDVDPDSDGLLETSGAMTIGDTDTGEANFSTATLSGTYGTLTIDAAGNWNYAAANTQTAIQTLPAGATLTDTFTVTTADGTTHDVVITINGTNDAPVANDDGPVAVNAGTPVTIDLAGNDTDIDDAIDLTSIIIVSGPAHGTLMVIDDGTVIYTHDGSATSTSDSFTYAIMDASGAVSNTATVTLLVDPADILDSTPGPAPQEAPVDDEEVTSDPPPREAEADEKQQQTLPQLSQAPDETGTVALAASATDDSADYTVDNVLLISQDNPGLTQRTLQGMIDKLEHFNHELWEVLDVLKNQMSSHDDAAESRFKLFVKSSTGLALTMSAGAVTWAIRGTSVMASMLSSMPLWKGFDPLPLLSARTLSRNRDEDGNDELSGDERIADERAAKLLDTSDPSTAAGQHQDKS